MGAEAVNESVSIRRSTGASDSRLSPEDMMKVLELLRGSTSVELKVEVPDTLRGTIRGLGFDPVDGEPRQTYFFDTREFALNRAGLIVRARRGPFGKGDTAIKLRPVDPAIIDDDLRHDEAFKIEVDVMPGGFVCSATSKGRCSANEVFEAAEGKRALSSIFNSKQRKFFAAHKPEGITLKDLVPIGPIFQLRLRNQPKDFDRRMIVEIWFYPDGSRVLEISTKGIPEEAFQLGVHFRAFLASHGIPLDKQSASKTSSAFAYFARQWKSAAPQAAVVKECGSASPVPPGEANPSLVEAGAA